MLLSSSLSIFFILCTLCWHMHSCKVTESFSTLHFFPNIIIIIADIGFHCISIHFFLLTRTFCHSLFLQHSVLHLAAILSSQVASMRKKCSCSCRFQRYHFLPQINSNFSNTSVSILPQILVMILSLIKEFGPQDCWP